MAKHQNSVYGKISEDIESKIVSGEYTVGSLLTPERKLMETYGVERTTIRRALELLVEKGLIVKKTGFGTVISDGKNIPVFKKDDAAKTVSAPVKKQSRKSLPKGIVLKNDITAAAKAVFARLSELGHKKIMYAGSDGEILSAVAGEMVRAGIYENDLVGITTSTRNVDYVFESIWRSIRGGNPTAVVTSSADDAQKIIERAERMRISVPEELTVVAVCSDKASSVGGCVFDVQGTEKKIIKMLENTADGDIQKIDINVAPEYSDGKTVAEAKSGGRGNGSMSAYLL